MIGNLVYIIILVVGGGGEGAAVTADIQYIPYGETSKLIFTKSPTEVILSHLTDEETGLERWR